MSRRAVMWTSLAAALLVVAHSVLWDIVRRRGGTFIADNAELVGIGTGKARLFRLSLIADALGSYLLTLPATVALWRLLRRSNADRTLVDVAALGGVVYAAAGAVAAAVLAVAGEDLIRAYATADASQGESVAATFGLAMNAAIGTWQVVCITAGAAWWIVSGLLLRDRWRWFARYSIAFGVVSLFLGAAVMAGVDFDSTAPATAAFLPIAIWIGWLGVRLERDRGD